MELKWDDALKYIEIELKEFQEFAKVPFAMVEGKHKVSGTAVKLYIVYYSFSRAWRGAKPKKIKERVSQSTIARKLGVKPKTVSILTTELYNKGWIDVEHTGRTNKITLYGVPHRLIE